MFQKISLKVSRMYQESLNEVSIAIWLHESHRSYPSRRRACLFTRLCLAGFCEVDFGRFGVCWLGLLAQVCCAMYVCWVCLLGYVYSDLSHMFGLFCLVGSYGFVFSGLGLLGQVYLVGFTGYSRVCMVTGLHGFSQVF